MKTDQTGREFKNKSTRGQEEVKEQRATGLMPPPPTKGDQNLEENGQQSVPRRCLLRNDPLPSARDRPHPCTPPRQLRLSGRFLWTLTLEAVPLASAPPPRVSAAPATHSSPAAVPAGKMTLMWKRPPRPGRHILQGDSSRNNSYDDTRTWRDRSAVTTDNTMFRRNNQRRFPASASRRGSNLPARSFTFVATCLGSFQVVVRLLWSTKNGHPVWGSILTSQPRGRGSLSLLAMVGAGARVCTALMLLALRY